MFVNCKKKGCTDVYAENYNSSIKRHNDFGCIYNKSYIPDDSFENFLEANNMGDGIPNNDSVLTNKINEQKDLDLKYCNITDLTGIEDFINLKNLTIDGSSGNFISDIDLSKNTELLSLNCMYNPISSIDLSNNLNLRSITFSFTNVSAIDFSNNELLESIAAVQSPLTALDLSNNPQLTFLSCSNTEVIELDLSANSNLTFLYCSDSPLEQLDLRNGNNGVLTNIIANNNPNLSCISVDDASWCSSNWLGFSYEFDNQVTFSNNCQ